MRRPRFSGFRFGQDKKGPSVQRCPECDAPIGAKDINIKEGVALCPQCGALVRLSELTDNDVDVDDLVDVPPSGCTIETHSGTTVTATASARSLGGFVACTAIALFWNGIVSVFLSVAIAGLYTNLVGPLPDWFPAPEMDQGRPKMNGGPMGLGATLFLCLFLTPFVIIGVALISGAVMSLIGRVDLVIDEFESYVATGVGFVRWKRRFDPRQMKSVKLHLPIRRSTRNRSQPSPTIEFVADETIRFGGMLPTARKNWMHALARTLLLGSTAARRRANLPELSWLDSRS
ncbi:MAG: hypothetical protein NXI04_02985 [Planctomycetaceae bacterium]|nr:hypothetical protein [Planctomycetaceae bacterium]